MAGTEAASGRRWRELPAATRRGSARARHFRNVGRSAGRAGRLPVEANGGCRTPRASAVPIRIPRACVLGASGVSSSLQLLTWATAAPAGERLIGARGRGLCAPRTGTARAPPRLA